jgi:hypothetical protein
MCTAARPRQQGRLRWHHLRQHVLRGGGTQVVHFFNMPPIFFTSVPASVFILLCFYPTPRRALPSIVFCLHACSHRVLCPALARLQGEPSRVHSHRRLRQFGCTADGEREQSGHSQRPERRRCFDRCTDSRSGERCFGLSQNGPCRSEGEKGFRGGAQAGGTLKPRGRKELLPGKLEAADRKQIRQGPHADFIVEGHHAGDAVIALLLSIAPSVIESF